MPYSDGSDFGKRVFTGAPLVCSTKAEDCVATILDLCDGIGVVIARVLNDLSDSAAPCLSGAKQLDAHKQAVVEKMLEQKVLHRPRKLLNPADIAHLFSVHPDQPELLLLVTCVATSTIAATF